MFIYITVFNVRHTVVYSALYIYITVYILQHIVTCNTTPTTIKVGVTLAQRRDDSADVGATLNQPTLLSGIAHISQFTLYIIFQSILHRTFKSVSQYIVNHSVFYTEFTSVSQHVHLIIVRRAFHICITHYSVCITLWVTAHTMGVRGWWVSCGWHHQHRGKPHRVSSRWSSVWLCLYIGLSSKQYG